MDFEQPKENGKLISNYSGVVINGNCLNCTIDNSHLEPMPKTLQIKLCEIDNAINEILEILKEQQNTIQEQNKTISKLLHLIEQKQANKTK